MSSSPPASSTSANNHDDDQCMVCLSPQNADTRLWTCSCCNKQCHLLCVFQWALRLSINHGRRFQHFSCPGCRTEHALNTLPGFEQHTVSTTSRRTRAATTAQLLEAEEEEENNDEDDANDDDETFSIESESSSTEQGGRRWNFRIETERIYVDVDALTINIHSR